MYRRLHVASKLKSVEVKPVAVLIRRSSTDSFELQYKKFEDECIKNFGVDDLWHDTSISRGVHLLPSTFKILAIVFSASGTSFENDSTRCKPIVSIPIAEFTSVFEEKALSDLSPKDKPWDKHRAEADLIRNSYLRSGYERYAERIDRCSTLLEFARVTDDQQFFYKLRSAHFCRHRHCTVCQWRRSLMWTARFLGEMPNIQRDYPTHRFIFLTLTIKNCLITDLRETIILMNKAWKRLTELKAFPAEGFVKSLEVTRAADGLAHPHFHILMMVPNRYFSKPGGYLSHARWLELWRKCLRINYEPTVHVKAVKPKSDSDLVGILKEVLKYSIKPSDLTVDTKNLTPTQIQDRDVWLAELTKQLHKTRAISLGGVFRKYLSEDEPEDLINVDEVVDSEPVTDERFLFDWRRDVKRYMQRKNSQD